MELAADIAPNTKKQFYKNQIDKYEQEKSIIKQKAESLEAASAKANTQSDQVMKPHHRLAQSMTLIQIAISLASITVLTRKKWLFTIATVAAVGGIVLWVEALI